MFFIILQKTYSMKKHLLLPLFALLILGLFFPSCKKTEITESVKNQDENLKNLQKNGFSIKGIVDKGDAYIVEGDILIYKKDIPFLGQPLNLKKTSDKVINQAHTGNLVQTTVITVFINNSIPSTPANDWVTAINRAVGYWNSIPNFGLQFIVSSSPSANITITSGSLPGSTIAAGTFPVNGNPGTTVTVDLSKATDSSLRQLVMTHELGHNIAFRHTDTFNDGGSTPFVNINGTIPSTSSNTNPDPNSVMNNGFTQISQSWRGFSKFDIIAARNIYPLDNTQAPLYRYYQSGCHFYTSNWAEQGSGTGWSYEGVEGYIFNIQVSGRYPLYRYYNSSSNDHLYTLDYNELGGGNYGYVYEGIVGYANNAQVTGSVPLYRFYNGRHFYTMNYNEGTGSGFTFERICCYVMP